MSRLIKIFLGITGVIVLLMLATVLFIVFLVNPNDYKAQLNQHVTAKIGREFAIRGNISWTFFPWLGMQAQDIRISNAREFGSLPFASVKKMDIKVKLLPLLHKQVEVGKIALHGAELNLQKNKRGKSNWQGLAEQLQQTDTMDRQAQSVANTQQDKKDINISISEIEVQDANVNWFNEQDNQQFVLSKLTMQGSNLNKSKPFAVSLSGSFTSTPPAISGNIKLTGDIQTNSEEQRYTVTNLVINGQLLDKAFQGKKLNFELMTDIVADIKKDTVSIENLTAAIANMQLRGEFTRKGKLLSGMVQVPNFNAKQFLQAVGETVPAMQNSQALQKVNAQFAIKANDNIELNNLRLNVDETSVLGNIIIQDLKTKRTSLQLAINKIKITDYIAPAKDKESKIINLTGIEYAGILSLPEGARQSLGQRLIANGKLRTGMLQFDKTQLTNLSAVINANQGLIKLAPVSAQLYQGKYLGNITLNLQQTIPAISVEQTFSGINIGGLLHDFKPLTQIQVTGVGEVITQLSATGSNWEQVRRTLSGKTYFAVNKGVLKGINLEHWLNVGSALYHHEPVPSSKVANETQFGKLTGTFNIDRGVAHNNDFLLQATFMRVTGQGTVNLVNERLNYLFNAVKMNPANKQPRKDVIPIRVSGTFSNISVKPDIEQLLRKQVKKEIANQADKLKEKVSEQLDKAVGKEIGDKIRQLNLDKLFGQ